MPKFTWNNHSIHYRQQGQGPLMVILPGNTASSACYQDEMAYFSDRYMTVAMDFLGTGESERVQVWAEDWWMQGARQVAALITHLGFEDGIVVGSSGGAVVALLAAIHYPNKVRAVIADSCSRNFGEQVDLDLLIKDRAQRTDGQKQFWQFAHGADWEQVVDADTRMLAQFAAGGGDWFSGQLGEIDCPVLLTVSRQDETTQDMAQDAEWMASQIKDCTLFIGQQGGHPLMWTDAQAFRSESDAFLAKTNRKLM